MERIVYNKTLDVHKNGVQFTLQGFETADNLARKIVISLMASGDAVDFPLEKIMAVMYVNTPKATEPSIIECEIKDNTVIYDVLPITEEGITEMQLKLIETSPEGATCVLATPKFAVEVTKSNADDESVKQTTTFTALEDAVAKAKGVYDERFLRLELSSDCMFRAFYADGTVYESDVLKELFHKGDALISQSYARGDSGVRTGEETDNAMYYCNVAKSASIESQEIKEDAQEILDEARLQGVYTAFSVDFESGEVEYVSPRYEFKVNTESGDLEVIGKAYTFEDDIGVVVEEWLKAHSVDINALQDISLEHSGQIEELQESNETHVEQIAVLQETTEAQGDGIAQIKEHIEWETLGSVCHKYTEEGQYSSYDKATTLAFPITEDILTEFVSFRYVLKAGSMVSVEITPTSNDYYSQFDAYLGIESNYGNLIELRSRKTTGYANDSANIPLTCVYNNQEDTIFPIPPMTSARVIRRSTYDDESYEIHNDELDSILTEIAKLSNIVLKFDTGDSSSPGSYKTHCDFTIELQGKR